MATIQIDVPDAMVTRITNAFKADQGWTSESGIPAAEVVKRAIKNYVKSVVVTYEARVAAEAAAEATKIAIDGP